MRAKKSILAATATITLLLASCSTPKNISYFPDLGNGTTIATSEFKEIRLKPEDKVAIIVTTQDIALSNLFNLVTAQTRLGVATTSTVFGNSANSNNSQITYYTIDSKGDIDFPVLGKIHIAGLTREQVAERISTDLQKANLVKDPVVTVEFANVGVSVMGEVNKPGRYEFNKDHITIIDALSMAGDLKMNGMRENILVMRKSDNGNQESYRVNLLNAQELASSPVFYLQQDDMIYVEPNDKAKRETTSTGNAMYNPSFWVSVGSLAVTVTTLIVTLNK